MKNKSQFILIIFVLVALSFPSSGFSAMQEVFGEYCDVYTGDMKNKKKLDAFKKAVTEQAQKDGVKKLVKTSRFAKVTSDCVNYALSNYAGKTTVVSHTESADKKGRKICEKVKINFDPDAISKYLSQEFCLQGWDAGRGNSSWCNDIDNVLAKKEGQLNVGLIIEIQIPKLGSDKKEALEKEEEKQFLEMAEINGDKYNILDKDALSAAAEKQKMSLSALTDHDIMQLGKMLNLDAVVHRVIYENSRTTKVRKINTGKVLLFSTYETGSNSAVETSDWVKYGKQNNGTVHFYKKGGVAKDSDGNILKIFNKWVFSNKEVSNAIQYRRENRLSTRGYDKLSHMIYLSEIDCQNQSERMIYLYLYDKDGKSLYSHAYNDPEWNYIETDSNAEALLKAVCK